MQDILTALKDAMRGEMDSISVYQNALDNAQENEVKDFFKSMVKEEQDHYNYLVDYYQSITDDVELKKIDFTQGKNLIFSESFKQKIGENQILFSAISVATLLEKNAFDFYQKTAENTENEILKEFFYKMAIWEKQHYDDLIEISEESEKYYWLQNRFEPF